MKIKQIMSSPVVTVEMDDSLSVLNTIFSTTKFHHIVVLEQKALVGIISDRDLFKALSPNLGRASETTADLGTLKKRAHQIMTREVVTLQESDSVRRVIEIFDTHRISCIPIVNELNRPVGIISWRDIIQLIRQRMGDSSPSD